ncbi:tumor necrosis factor receptor superfamily member 5-like [Protopterus annectens]|uniref:tumor necrosis factor receptor superfamily member 5-like n=1 Tax=Protopterus annectens TaxID=7888 RepID=UPI001CF9C7AB|nr:tumor necrosis factor receptor superfamily member 5-like [Protopterus annectens]
METHSLTFMLLTQSTFCLLRVQSSPACSSDQYPIGNRCCARCPAGQYAKTDCTSTNQTECAACGQGKFTSKPNGLSNCLRCKTCETEMGLTEASSCNATADTSCKCKPEMQCVHRSTDGSCLGCEPLPLCPVGMGLSKDPHSGIICENCPNGTFSTESSLDPCQPWTRCEDLVLVRVENGSATSDVKCGHRSRIVLLIGVLMITPLALALIPLILCIRRWRYGGKKTRKCTIMKNLKSNKPFEEIELNRSV